MDNRVRKIQLNKSNPIFFPILQNKLLQFRIFNRLKFNKLVTNIRKILAYN